MLRDYSLRKKQQAEYVNVMMLKLKEIREIDCGDVIRKYRSEFETYSGQVVDLQMMFSNLYELVNSKRYLAKIGAHKNDYELLYQAVYYYIDQAYINGNDDFFYEVFYNRREINLKILQKHFPDVEARQLEVLEEAINSKNIVDADSLEEYNILCYMEKFINAYYENDRMAL